MGNILLFVVVAIILLLLVKATLFNILKIALIVGGIVAIYYAVTKD